MDGVSGIILAGGKSTRMRRGKAALPFGSGTLLTAQTDKLRSLGITDIVLSGYAEGMVPDETPGCGPLGGLAACLPRVQNPCALVLSVDAPLIPVEALRALLAAHAGGATLLRHGDKLEPLIAVYDAALAAAARRLLAQGRYAVRALLEQTEWRAVDFDAPDRCFLNCNTPESYAAALQAIAET